jgi:hypothetical protein
MLVAMQVIPRIQASFWLLPLRDLEKAINFSVIMTVVGVE